MCKRLASLPNSLPNSILGSGFLATAATIVLLLGEAAIPVTVLFGRRLESLQGQLFDETLRLRGVTVHPIDTAGVLHTSLSHHIML